MANPVVANVTHSKGMVYTASYGEAEPADDVAYGTAWGGNWARVGYTMAPVTLAYEDERAEIGVQEALTKIKEFKTAESVVLETTLAELDASYLNLAAASGAVTDTAAGADQVQKEAWVVGGESVVNEYAWGIEARYIDGSGTTWPIRIYVWKGVAKLNGALEFSKDADAAVGIGLQISALADTTKSEGQQLLKFERVLAAASS